MTLVEIQQIIQQARDSRGRLQILGYFNADGEQYDYIMRVHGRDYYPQLMRETVTWLQDLLGSEPVDMLLKLYGQDPVEDMVTVDLVRRILQDELSKLQAKLTNPPDSAPTSSPADPAVVVLTDVEVLSSTKPKQKAASTRVLKIDAMVTKRIKDAWPLSKYSARYHLKEGKFTALRLLSEDGGA